MLEIEPQYVRTGRWTNLEDGPIMGQTITVDARTGTVVVAFLALFASLGLNHLFHLIVFVYHQFRADGIHRNGLFHQQQALLGTLPTPGTLLADSIKLWYFWKRISKQAFQHSIILVFFSGFFAVGSIMASIFSSYVVSNNANIEVLVSSPYCAYINRTAIMVNSTLPMIYLTPVNTLAFSYIYDCYNKTDSWPARCKSFTRPQIHFSTEEAPCPYANLCSSSAITFDSGLMELDKAFGLNVPTRHRVKYRKKDTCAILSQEGRVWGLNSSELPEIFTGKAAADDEYLLYSYGRRDDFTKWSNATFFASLATSNASKAYTIMQQFHFADAPGETFLPPPQMARDDADILVRLISKNSVSYMTPVDDPMFSAHKLQMEYSINYNRTFPYYQSDTHGTVVGCIEQYQYCIFNASSEYVCSPLRGILSTNISSVFPDATAIQSRMLENLAILGEIFSLKSTTNLLTSRILEDSRHIYWLPNDHWKKELYAWEATVWAAYQIAMSDIAIGPRLREPNADLYTRGPVTEAEHDLCRMQKMRKSGGFVNINLFGCIFIITVSGTVTLLDICILRCLIYLGRFRKALSPRIDRWLQDGVFQLQRRAYEAQDEGLWTRQECEIPLTIGNTELPDLPIEGRNGNGVCKICRSTPQVGAKVSIFSNLFHDESLSTESIKVKQGSK